MIHYSKEIEEQMVKHYKGLNERDRRRYAAVEVLKLPRGGQSYIKKLLGCDHKTIRKGRKDLHNLKDPPDRIRKKGGGRKKNN